MRVVKRIFVSIVQFSDFHLYGGCVEKWTSKLIMKKLLKKAFTVSVVAVTIVWSVGLSALVPTMVNAVTCPTVAGDSVIKVTPPAGTAKADLVNYNTMWYVDSNLNKHAFPSGDVLKTWYADYHPTNRVDLPVGCQANYPDAKNVNFFPGTLITDPAQGTLFVMEAGNKKTEVTTDVAKAIYGDNYKAVNYNSYFISDLNFSSVGTKLTTAKLLDGMLVKKTGGDTYQVVGGKLYKVDGTLPTYMGKNVYTVSAALFDGTEKATTNVTAASTYANPAQSTGTAATTPTTPAATTGNVGVSLSANTSAGGNVVINIDNVVFGKFILSATNGDYTVSSVKIGRKGLGAKGDFTSVTLYDGGTKLGTTKTSWDSNTETMVYNIPTGWKITNGTTKELTVVAKLDTAGTYNSLGILAVNDTAVTPVYGNEMTGVSVSVGGVTISPMGSSAIKKIGVAGVTLSEFKLTVSSTEDGTFKGVLLKNFGTASDDDIANVYLYKGSVQLAGPVSMASDKINFVISEDKYVSIAKSKNETFKVVGDIVKGDTHTLEFELENTTDLAMAGVTYGTSLSVHNDSFNNASDSGMIITIDGAELNVAYTGSNLDTMDDVTDVVFGTLTLGAGSTDIKITSLILNIDETEASGSAGVLDVDNFEMIETNGGAYSGTATTGDDASSADEVWTFSDEIYISAGQTRTFTLRGDLPNSIANGDSYKVVVTTVDTSSVVAETVPEGDTVSNFSVGSITGKLITVKSPTLKVSGLTQNDGTAVVNDTDVILYKGTLEAQASDIKVSYANFDANTTFATANWAEVGFYLVKADGSYDQKQLLTTSQMTSGTLSFDSMDFTVLNGPTNKATFVIKGKVAATVTAANGLVAKLKLNYFTAKASDNSSPTITSTGSDDLDETPGTTFLTSGYRQVTLADKGKLYIQMRSSDSGFAKDRILLAGTSAWVGKIKLKADDESIKVKDLRLVNVDTSGADDDLASVCLYRAQVATAENLISCQTVDSNGVVFYDDINEEVTQGTEYWYIYVNSNKMSNLAGGEADSNQIFSFRVASSSLNNGTVDGVVAEGVRSGHQFTFNGESTIGTVAAGEWALDVTNNDAYTDAADTVTAYTKQFIIAGTKISNVQLVSSYGGYTVDTVLNGTDTFVAAILAVTTEATDNTSSTGNALKTEFTGLSFDVAKAASTSISAVTIQKIGGLDGAASLVLSEGLTPLNSPTSTAGTASTSTLNIGLDDDYLLDPGTTSYFVIKATVNAVSSATNYTNFFRFDMNDLKGTYTDGGSDDDTDNNIDWEDGAISDTFSFNALFLDTESITGTKVYKTNN